MRHRIKAGEGFERGKFHGGEVGGLARRDGADVAVEAERARAAQRGHLERLGGAERRGIAARALGEERRGSHLGHDIEAVVARRAVGADADVDAAAAHRRHRRETARELQVG